ncbi:MAG: deoxyribodipyrimidine photo-lyase/cryptochrome family protein [Gammaproteobacteria bacterium]|nr:deoxyribodipyrimidine photo-lyase/cryptochrome family protein [Gammaproteobacteria bacterium]
MIHVVWFKRDLRTHDHRPLVEAAQRGPVLPLYVIEEDYWYLPDTSLRQWRFTAECLAELDTALERMGQRLILRRGSVPEVLDLLHRRHRLAGLYSHEETGNAWTYQRDLAVAAWARRNNVPWQQYPPAGVVRRLESRDRWARHWEQRMAAPLLRPPDRITGVRQHAGDRDWLTAPRGHDRSPCPGRQTGGRAAGVALLESFLSSRGERYRYAISSPLTAATSGSRLSPYLAYGAVGLREVVQATRLRLSRLQGPADTPWRKSLESFQSRLYWHCHFIQKLEDQPDVEHRNLHPGYDALRDEHIDPERFEAWRAGRTGFPFVDACMRMLWGEGWINFRMRAMLAAFSSYHLWLHWRQPGLHLARLFVDYEPGIHYNQLQMQSGTTGINANRIYNPVKQSLDQDASGSFIRRWVPELQGIADERIHEPWRLTPGEQRRLGVVIGRDYPARIVDHLQAARAAREHLRSFRQGRGDLRIEAQAIHARHGSRRRSQRRSVRRRGSQLDLPLSTT